MGRSIHGVNGFMYSWSNIKRVLFSVAKLLAYMYTCIILRGKLKEAVTGYKSHVHRGGTCDPSCCIWYS